MKPLNVFQPLPAVPQVPLEIDLLARVAMVVGEHGGQIDLIPDQLFTGRTIFPPQREGDPIRFVLLQGMRPIHRLNILLHESAHRWLEHDTRNDASEVEAELVFWRVCDLKGLDPLTLDPNLPAFIMERRGVVLDVRYDQIDRLAQEIVEQLDACTITYEYQ